MYFVCTHSVGKQTKMIGPLFYLLSLYDTTTIVLNHWMQCAKLQSIKNLFSYLKYVSMYIWQSYSSISESCTKFPLQLNFI